MTKLRIGTLGCARITPIALLRPAREVVPAQIVAVASRDLRRAQRFATEHGIPRAYGDYQHLIDDDGVDAIYNPLPNSLHHRWTIAALRAGKHVLCEKPIAANAAQAEEMHQVATESGAVLMEALHWRHHPLADRMREIVGELGVIRHIETTMCIPLPLRGDIRYRFELAGGATMDVGAYTTSILRFLAGAEPEVVAASAKLARRDVDRWMQADLRFADGATARTTCSLFAWPLLNVSAEVRADGGTLHVLNPVAPHLRHELRITRGGRTSTETVPGEPTYRHQLRAFVTACLDGAPVITTAAEGAATMRVIDAIYTAAGLPLRG